MPGSPHHATMVWDAILAAELSLDNPLAFAPVFWKQFLLHQSIAPSIAGLYIETGTLLQIGLKEAATVHGAIGWAGTLELWLDILPHLFAALATYHTLHRPWEDSMLYLCGTQLWTA